MDLQRWAVEQNFPGVEPGEAAGAAQGWIMENLVNHFREFGIYRVALGSH